MQKAKEPFHYTTDDGVDRFVAKGDVVGDKDPVLKGRESLFVAVADPDAPKK